MISRSLALGLLAAGCVAAAGGGAYVAVRQNAAEPVAVTAPVATAVNTPAPAQQPVAETEALVAPTSPEPVEAPAEPPAPAAAASARRVSQADAAPPVERRGRTRGSRTGASRAGVAARPQPAAPVEPGTATQRATPETRPQPATPSVESAPEPPRYAEPPAPPEPQYEEVTLPASAVIGLQIETALSSERAQVEDRVSARVTRDVMSGGRVAIPAGSRVLGSVTLVEKGGKVKERARLGVRFHTLVLADGSEVPLRTEAITREGESPVGDSSRKIGGAAVGGAILGAILGGGKGAMIGGATGAAGGTAAVMAGDRHAATLPNGTIVTVRVSSPVDIQVEKR